MVRNIEEQGTSEEDIPEPPRDKRRIIRMYKEAVEDSAYLGSDKISPQSFLTLCYHYHLGIGVQINARKAQSTDASQVAGLKRTQSHKLVSGVAVVG